MRIKTNWNLNERHTYGSKAETNQRATYGEHIRYGGVAKVKWKFIKTDYVKV